MRKIIVVVSIGLLISFSLFADVQVHKIHSENVIASKSNINRSNYILHNWRVSLADKTVYYDTPSEGQVIVDETWQNQNGLQWHQVYQLSEDEYFNEGNQNGMELYQYLQSQAS